MCPKDAETFPWKQISRRVALFPDVVVGSEELDLVPPAAVVSPHGTVYSMPLPSLKSM